MFFLNCLKSHKQIFCILETIDPFNFANIPPVMNFLILPGKLEATLNFTLSHPNFQKLMSEQYDVVIVETFHSEVLLGKCERLTNYETRID
jgi:hypothetical protein